MYFFKEKRFVILFLLVVRTLCLFAQENKGLNDSLAVKNDTIKIDTVNISVRKPASGGIESRITYKAKDAIKRDLVNKRFILTNSSEITYGDLLIKADSIMIDMNSNILYAIGRKDTTGKVQGKPSFKQGSNEFDSDELTYNFKTKKALVKNIITKQDAGLLHSQFTKLLEDGTSNIFRSTYSTCDADTPHFYINLPKARVYPGKKIVSGPGNLVVEGIPLPLAVPFGFFPIQTKRAASGIIIPRYGEERVRGFSLTDGGYYFAISDYFDLQVRGSLYANGSWLGTAQSNYKRLYKYSGNFTFSYADNVSGHKGLSDFSRSKNYRVGWTFQQDAKASPGSTFNASVNMSSPAYDKNNSYNVSDHIATTRQSSISYSKSWDGLPINFSISANHSQNVSNKTVSMSLPRASFNVSRIYPFRGKNSSGSSKWYQDIQLSYSASLDNQIDTKDSLLFTNQVWKHMKNGFKHDIPLSIQLRPFNNFNISPSITYSGVMYTQKIDRKWYPAHQNPALDSDKPTVVTDTLHGVFYGHAINPSISASFNPQIYGLYDFTQKSPNSRLKLIQHVMKPSVSFSFTPAFAGLSSKMYRQEQVPLPYELQNKYSIFEGNIYGTPSLAQKSGSLNFSLVNLVTAKMQEKNDTIEKLKKVKLIDNFSINTSYNIFADKFKWAPVTMDLTTSVMNSINISVRSSFSLYGTDSTGAAINKFLFSQNNKLMRLTSFTSGIDFSLSDLLKGDKQKGRGAQQTQNNASTGIPGNTGMVGQEQPGQQQGAAGQKDAYGYPVFNMPWSLRLRYSLSYIPSQYKSQLDQKLSFDGSVTMTKKMSATYSSGYDFNAKQITYTTIGISRDLHCWEMNLNWIPIGSMKGWNFLIRVKASVLGDLKYERRKDYHDSY